MIDAGGIWFGEVTKVNALQCLVAKRSGQLLPQRVRQEGNKRGDDLGQLQHDFVERPVRIVLVGRIRIGGPETIATSTDVPIAETIEQVRDRLARVVVVKRIHPIDDRRQRAMQFGMDPSIDLAPFANWAIGRCGGERCRTQLLVDIRRGCGIETVDLCIDRKEAVRVPKPQQELRDRIADCLIGVDDRIPWRLVGEEIPTHRIGAVLVEDLRRTAVVPKTLGHFAGLLGELAFGLICFGF